MSETHDYETVRVRREDLNVTHVLVGESGGLCAIYHKPEKILGMNMIETEYGMLLLLMPEYEVLA
jgi:hypothetical protein